MTHRYTDGTVWSSIYKVCAYGENECKGLIIDRLAAYEDTGLTPEEIKALIPPPNDPLTLEELREMDGEQVWIDQPDRMEDPSGWARVELAFPWKPNGLKPHVFVVYPNGDRDYAGLLLECGDKIYRRKSERSK